MAVPSYATDLVDIVTSFSTGWSLTSEGGGGQNALTAPETDDFIQGTESVSRNPFSTSIRGIIYDKVTTVAVAAGDAVFYWWKADVAAALDTFANGGVHLTMGTSTTAYKKFYVAGSDTYALGGWKCIPIDPDNTGSLDRGSPGLPDYDFFGVAYDIPASGPSKGYPFKCDMIRHGRTVDVTDGEIANPASWDTLTIYADTTIRRWGLVQATDTGAQLQGIINWGTAAASVYSRDANRAIVLLDTEFTISSFTQLIFNNASTDLEWDGMSITALGTNNRGIITINNNASVSITTSVITDIDTTADGGTNSVWLGTTWTGCNAVTSNGGSFIAASILSPTVLANTSGFIYDIATDPDGILDGMEFSEGGNLHHAIEFGITSPLSMTLNDIDFSGFSASINVNNSTFHIKRTSGTVTINLVGCSGNFGYRTDGATVVLVQDPVTTTVNVKDTLGNNITGARVYLEAADGTGDLPYQDSVSISSGATLATVTHTAHGLSTNNWVNIVGATTSSINGAKQITVLTVNSYTYPDTSNVGAVGGTITSTGVVINEVTSGTGTVTDTRTFGVNQPVVGWSRKSTASPLYITSIISTIINNVNGVTISSIMVSDE